MGHHEHHATAPHTVAVVVLTLSDSRTPAEDLRLRNAIPRSIGNGSGDEMSPPLGGGTRILFYILSFLIPIAGFIVGAIYLSNNNPENQGVGKTCLIIAILAIIVGCLCYVFGTMVLMDSMSGGTFQCGSGEIVPSSYVNDGMCDCYDCSDE